MWPSVPVQTGEQIPRASAKRIKQLASEQRHREQLQVAEPWLTRNWKSKKDNQGQYLHFQHLEDNFI